METIVNACLQVLSLYLLIGLIFAGLFIWKGAAKIDEGVSGSTRGFKLIILPGVIFLWPLLLPKWIKKRNS